MRNAVMFLFVFLAVLVISVNHAVARQWTSDLEYMTCTPGTTQLEFPPRCNRSPRLLSGGGGEDPEAIAGWLIDFLVPMSASQVDAVLAEVDPGGVLGLSGNALKAMSHAELVTLVQSIETEHPSLYASLLQAKSGVEQVPCGQKVANGKCESGHKCKIEECTKEDQSTERCVTYVMEDFDLKYSGCPGFIWKHYSCPDPCVPMPTSVALLAACVACTTYVRLRSRHARIE